MLHAHRRTYYTSGGEVNWTTIYSFLFSDIYDRFQFFCWQQLHSSSRFPFRHIHNNIQPRSRIIFLVKCRENVPMCLCCASTSNLCYFWLRCWKCIYIDIEDRLFSLLNFCNLPTSSRFFLAHASNSDTYTNSWNCATHAHGEARYMCGWMKQLIIVQSINLSIPWNWAELAVRKHWTCAMVEMGGIKKREEKKLTALSFTRFHLVSIYDYLCWPPIAYAAFVPYPK